ncbi:MAG: omptin family outer membrane protease [Spirochaetaceae bacterium]|jgi:outer membrane protease|nr:omptin family outer membrane protease [Spirochaetaceae bacterium]
MKRRPKKHLTLQKALLPALVMLAAGPGHAEVPLGGSIQLFTGVLFGGMTEYVYERGREQDLSRLEWEENFVPFLDLIGEFTIWNIFLRVSVLTAIPIQSGRMRDYDYMLPDSGARSHYSEHNAMFDKHLEIEPEIGCFFSAGRFSFAPGIGVLFRSRKWTAADGFVQYPVSGAWSEDTPKQGMAGAIISYEESTWFPTINLDTSFWINDRFTLGLTTVWYPYLEVKTIDSHYLRATRFHDEMRGGTGCLAEVFLVYSPVKKTGHYFMASFGYEGLFPTKGSSGIGAMGYDNGLVWDNAYQSKMVSHLFWFSIGIMLYPEEIWPPRPLR